MPGAQPLSRDFWLFWAGQTISNLGSSMTMFALPLLVYQLTGSALNLGLSFGLGLLPHLLFGLLIGAWADRVDRKRLMIVVDVLQALVVTSLPLLAMAGALRIEWIYVTVFVGGVLNLCFQAAEFAAIPSLVAREDLVTANGRIQASYAAATVAGPLLAGVLVALMPVYDLLLIDAASFVLSAGCLALIRRRFNGEGPPRTSSIAADIGEGLRYVWGHPVLRNISLMMALVNLVGATVYAQLVLFVSQRYGASEAQLGLFFSVGSVGVVAISLAAGALRRRFSFSKVALGALTLSGLTTLAMALTPWYWLGLALWAATAGLGILFNINTGSLRQAIVPQHLLGRVISVAMMIGLSATPLGALLGGLAIERTGDAALVYAVCGALTALIPLAFALTPLGRAEQYIPAAAASVNHDGEAHTAVSA
jgi:MFS family permease